MAEFSIAEHMGNCRVSTAAVRQRNQAETRRLHAIENVMARLDVIEALFDPRSVQSARRRQATQIVDAVLALTKPTPEPVNIHALAERMRHEAVMDDLAERLRQATAVTPCE